MKHIDEHDLKGFIPIGGSFKGALLILTGYGDSAKDFFPLVKMLSRTIKDYAIFTLAGPHKYENPKSIPMERQISVGARQWFSLKSYFANVDGFRPGDFAPHIADNFCYVDSAIKKLSRFTGIPPEKFNLFCFSQGAMVGLGYALTSGEKTGHVISVAGLGDFGADKIVKKPSVLALHGSDDKAVPIIALDMLEETLAKASVPLKAVKIPGVNHDNICTRRDTVRLTTKFMQTCH